MVDPLNVWMNGWGDGWVVGHVDGWWVGEAAVLLCAHYRVVLVTVNLGVGWRRGSYTGDLGQL